jgi:hypothetical protein
MKSNTLKVLLLSLFLFVNLAAFAEPGDPCCGGGDGPGVTDEQEILEDESTGEEEEVAANPINSNIYLLAGAGILVGAFVFNRNKFVKA